MIINKIFRALIIGFVVGIFFLGEVLAQSPRGGNPDSTFICGDVNGDGEVTGKDSGIVFWQSMRLKWLESFSAKDSAAADVTGNGEITPFDATLISHYVEGLRDTLNCNQSAEDSLVVEGVKLDLVDIREEYIAIEMDMREAVGTIYSIDININYPRKMDLEEVQYLPDGWSIGYTGGDSVANYRYSLTNYDRAYSRVLEQPKLILLFRFSGDLDKPLSGFIRVNENVYSLGKLDIESQINEFILSRNYPNPFNPTTTIGYQVPETGRVKLEVFDLTGRKVRTLVNRLQTPGHYRVYFDGNGLSSGMYIYRLQAGGTIQTKTMTLIK